MSSSEVNPAQPSKFRTGLKRTGKAFLILAVVIVVAHGTVSLIYGRKVAANIDAIRATGQPVSLAELGKRLAIPDSENAAIIYAKANALLPKGKAEEEMAIVLSDLLYPANRPRSPEAWKKASTLLSEYRAVFPLIEQAASMPQCRFPIKWEKGFSMDYPQGRAYFARFMAVQALMKSRSGDTDGALRSLETGFLVSRSLEGEPMLASQMFREMIIRMQSDVLKEVLSRGTPSETESRRFYDILSAIDLEPDHVAAMRTERLWGIWIYDSLRKPDPAVVGFMVSNYNMSGTPSLLYMNHTRVDQPDKLGWKAKALIFLWRPLSYIDENIFLEHMEKAVADSALLARELSPTEPPRPPMYAFVANMISTPVWRHTNQGFYNGMTAIAGSRIALALAAHKVRRGEYPASLAQLRAKLGWEIPADPFSGKDFIYRREGKGYLLYSVGQNLRDDKAQPTNDKEALFAYKNTKGEAVTDIVWELSK